jgi:hypothetical protein
MKKILVIAAILLSGTSNSQGTYNLECSFAKSLYQARISGMNQHHAQSLLIENNTTSQLPSFLVKRLFDMVNTAYSWRYPTVFYTPKSFAKSAYGCK